MNCIGTILAAYGPDQRHRNFLPEKTISSIKTYAIIDKFTEPSIIRWELTAVIPFTAFIYDEISFHSMDWTGVSNMPAFVAEHT